MPNHEHQWNDSQSHQAVNILNQQQINAPDTLHLCRLKPQKVQNSQKLNKGLCSIITSPLILSVPLRFWEFANIFLLKEALLSPFSQKLIHHWAVICLGWLGWCCAVYTADNCRSEQPEKHVGLHTVKWDGMQLDTLVFLAYFVWKTLCWDMLSLFLAYFTVQYCVHWNAGCV